MYPDQIDLTNFGRYPVMSESLTHVLVTHLLNCQYRFDQSSAACVITAHRSPACLLRSPIISGIIVTAALSDAMNLWMLREFR